MGYYDEDYQPETRTKSKGTIGRGITAFISSVLGAVIVLVSVPLLANFGLLPYEVVPKNQQTETLGAQESMSSTQLDSTLNISVNSGVIEAVERVSEAVVGVINLRQADVWSTSGGEGTGSGVIYKKTKDHAYIVTNQHVIDGAQQIEVSLSDGSRVSAKLLGADVITDLAVLQIPAEAVTSVAEFGNSELLRVGEPAIAIGNPLGLQFSRTVTQGIISATERSVPVDLNKDGSVDWEAEVLQTDAAINPGNSGGALINIQGQVIGINSMKIAGSIEGIGFSIPSAIVVPVIDDLETYGEVKRPQMGIVIRSLSEIPSFHWQDTFNLPDQVKTGVVLEGVEPKSPAELAGLAQYDVIVELDGQAIQDTHDLRKHLYTKKKIGDDLEVTFYRDGVKQTIKLTLAEQKL
jgi:serine protease Do